MATKSNLRQLREAAGLSVRELARQIGESHTNVIYWERSGQIPRSDVLAPMAKALGITVHDLLGEPKPGRVVLRRETAHRGGKVVIVIDDFAPHISLAAIEELGRKLRHACGCGGTIRQRSIELQGNQAAQIRSFLEKEGFTVAGIT